MKEGPILFTGEMVRAIIDGRKTQTRRPCKVNEACADIGFDPEDDVWVWSVTDNAMTDDHASIIASPVGTVGDRLWVREAFYEAPEGGVFAYRASDDMPESAKRCGCKWTPSIHMPRWASRITLEITAVRVERVQEITDFDAFQEGAPSVEGTVTGPYCKSFKDGFRTLWQSIYGNWDANPWVWVYEFKRITP